LCFRSHSSFPTDRWVVQSTTVQSDTPDTWHVALPFSKGFWRCCTTLRITALLDFRQRPEFQITSKHNVSETGCVSVLWWGEGGTCSVGSLRKS
jgi:hypothetical protein